MKYTIAALAATTLAANAASYTLLTEKETLDYIFTGADVAATFGINGAASMTGTLLTSTGTSQTTLTGQDAVVSGGTETWTNTVVANTTAYTIEIRMRFNQDAHSGFNIFGGNGDHRNVVGVLDQSIEITGTGGGSKSVAFDSSDGQFHTYRFVVDHATNNDSNHMYVDGVRISDDNGGAYTSGTNDSRLLFGDTTSRAFGDNLDVDIAYIAFDDGAFAPVVPEPSSAALLGLGGLALILRRRK